MTDVIRLGNAAQRLLEDDTVKQVLTTLEAQYVREWKDATTPESREAAWHRQRVLDDFQAGLRRLRDSGTRASRTA